MKALCLNNQLTQVVHGNHVILSVTQLAVRFHQSYTPLYHVEPKTKSFNS